MWTLISGGILSLLFAGFGIYQINTGHTLTETIYGVYWIAVTVIFGFYFWCYYQKGSKRPSEKYVEGYIKWFLIVILPICMSCLGAYYIYHASAAAESVGGYPIHGYNALTKMEYGKGVLFIAAGIGSGFYRWWRYKKGSKVHSVQRV